MMKENKEYYVYQYVRDKDSKNGLAGTPYYIGKGMARRAWTKRKDKINLPIDKNFIVIHSDNLFEKDALQLEMFLIYLYGRIDENKGCLRNLTDGGEGGRGQRWSEETRLKQVQRMIGNKHSVGKNLGNKYGINSNKKPEHRKAISARTRGRRISEEQKEKLSTALKGRVFTEEWRNNMSIAQLNRPPPTEETRKKLSEAQLKRPPRTAELGRRISEGKMGKPSGKKGKKYPGSVKAKRKIEIL